jgi:hypothetical protein
MPDSLAGRWVIVDTHTPPRVYSHSYSSYGGHGTVAGKNRRGNICQCPTTKRPATWATKAGAETYLKERLSHPGSSYEWTRAVRLDYTDDELDRLVEKAGPVLLAVLQKWQCFMHNNYTPECLTWWDETEAAVAAAVPPFNPDSKEVAREEG